MRLHRGAAALLLAAFACAAPPCLADWTATGTVQYRDRELDGTGFTGVEPLLPVRFADVEVLDAVASIVLASGSTDGLGGFSILVPDSQIRDVEVRILTRALQTADLNLEVTTAAFDLRRRSCAAHQ